MVLLSAAVLASVRCFESLGQICSLVLKLGFIFVICVLRVASADARNTEGINSLLLHLICCSLGAATRSTSRVGLNFYDSKAFPTEILLSTEFTCHNIFSSFEFCCLNHSKLTGTSKSEEKVHRELESLTCCQ